MYRFSPSPTEDMHIGNLRVALFNFICSQQTKEKFIIKIEDTDKAREILEILNLFGITYDQILYQSENLKFHRQLGSKLLMDGHAFSCFCKGLESTHYDGRCKKLTDQEVMANENPFVVRIKKPNVPIEFTDLINGNIKFEPKDIDDFVILKVDKTPTYNFACAIDDMLNNVSLIITDDKNFLNASKQELIRKYLRYSEKIEFVHLPSILCEKDDIPSVKWLLEEGFMPTAIINYLTLIGNKTPTEIFTLDDALTWFDIKNISKEPMKFDIEKLKKLNREHIRELDPLELSKFIGYSSRDLGELAKLYLEEVSTINEIKAKIDTIFSIKTCEDFKEEFELLKNISVNLPYFKEFDEFEKYLMQESGLKGEKFFNPLRVLLTGAKSGPNLSEIYPHIKNYLGEIIKL